MKNSILTFAFLISIISCNKNESIISDTNTLDSLVSKYVDNGSQALLLVRLEDKNGKPIYQFSDKNIDLIPSQDINENTWFRIWSMSKIITISITMDLVEDGLLKLSDPVSKYIPEFKNPQILDSLLSDGTYLTIPAKNKITIRHLLTHTSGIGYGELESDPRIKEIYKEAGIVDLFTTKKISIGENIKKLATLPLHHNPGKAFTYSESYDVLGYFIEVISGIPFDVFLRTRIFDPLEMNDTWFYAPESKAGRLVSVQTKKDERWINYPVTFYDPQYPIKGENKFFSGGYGLGSKALDYAKFLQMYLNKGELNGKSY